MKRHWIPLDVLLSAPAAAQEAPPPPIEPRLAVPPTIDEALDWAFEKTGTVVPLAHFVYADPYSRPHGKRRAFAERDPHRHPGGGPRRFPQDAAGRRPEGPRGPVAVPLQVDVMTNVAVR